MVLFVISVAGVAAIAFLIGRKWIASIPELMEGNLLLNILAKVIGFIIGWSFLGYIFYLFWGIHKLSGCPDFTKDQNWLINGILIIGTYLPIITFGIICFDEGVKRGKG